MLGSAELEGNFETLMLVLAAKSVDFVDLEKLVAAARTRDFGNQLDVLETEASNHTVDTSEDN